MPWKIIYQNIRCLISENSRKKIEYFREFTSLNEVLIINLTETWLDETIDKDAKINGYKEFRSDRIGIKQGGTIIYTNDELECEVIAKISKNKCEMIAINIVTLNTINIVVYRPPHTKSEDFYPILDKIEEIFKGMRNPNPTILMTGDFNFPFVKWKCNSLDSFNGCMSEYDVNINATVDEKMQFERLTKLADQYNLIQTIERPTREENGKKSTLDLIYTNDIGNFKEIGIYKSCMSDHHTVEITTGYTPKIKSSKDNANGSTSILRNLNFYGDQIKWKYIIKRIKETIWPKMLENKTMLELFEIFMNLLIIICEESIPNKNAIKKNAYNKIPKVRKKLLGRMKKIKKDHRKAVSEEKREELSKKIKEVEEQLIKERKKERIEYEKKIVNKIKSNPKVLYSYVRRENCKKDEIGPFREGDNYIYDNKELGRKLINQYKNQFSKSRTVITNENWEEIFNDTDQEDLTDINVTEIEILNAIGELDENSSAGPDDIPAIFLIKTKEALAYPLKILLRKSLDEGIIPDVHKLANITPIHKGGAKTKPEQYRPVSLTSHVIKIFERVLKKHIMEHLIKNSLINEAQHGFVPGRSTQTQLLVHFRDIFEAMEEGTRMDTVFLDFSKAFDKVDHNTLLKKIAKHKIKGKVGRWIREFLKNRKFTVIVNGTISEQEEVLSGVPQGTVLAAILFIIMIADIDDKIKECTVRCFADDTRVSKKITEDADKMKLQEALNIIYKWAEENLMMFNVDKFEQLNYGETDNVTVTAYKDPSNINIRSGESVKDLGVITNKYISFKEHIQSIVLASKRMCGIICRTFATRDPEIMLKLFNTYIRSKLEYCCSIWSPTLQSEINELERMQKTFTSKIYGMEEKDYHERLKILNLYSLERRRERYFIIYAWQMIERIKENVLNLKTIKNQRRGRFIWSRPTRWSYRGKKIKHSSRTIVHNSTAKRMERLFNCLPPYIRNIEGKTVETFKKALDKWLQGIPDMPKIDNYGARVAADDNSIMKQAAVARWR